MSNLYYTKLEEVHEKLNHRRLYRREVERYWELQKIPFPAIMRRDPVAVLGRQVATFRFEDAVFILNAEALGMMPVWLTYHEDIFVTGSAGKRSLVRPKLTGNKDTHGGFITMTKALGDIGHYHRQKLGDISFSEGEHLTHWHRKRLTEAYPDAVIRDMSDMCKAWGGRADLYYRAYLSLFLAHGVLFEDYHGGESGKEQEGLTKGIFEPAVAWLESVFGVTPIIVALQWKPELGLYPEGEMLSNWRFYANSLR